MTVDMNLTSFHELADEAFLLVAECERQVRQSEDFMWNNVFIDEKNDENKQNKSEQSACEVIGPFINNLGDRIEKVLPGYGYTCSVIVYFMPGTWSPLPVFIKTAPFAKTSDFSLWKGAIETKVIDISRDLRHSGMPVSLLGSSHSPVIHVFYFAYQYVSIVGQAVAAHKKVSDRMKYSSYNIGNSGLSVWIDLKYPLGIPYELPIDCDGISKGKLVWSKGNNVPLLNNFLIISPIFLNEDTMVLMASYFDHDLLLGKIEGPADMKQILGFHGSLARQVFSPLYTAMLRGDMARLRMNLHRNNISSALLDCAAKHLSSTSLLDTSSFSYAWKGDDGKLRYSDDFRWSIYGDIIKHPDSVFTHVLFLENRVYETIQQNSSWNNINPNINDKSLPTTMPLLDLLRAVEELGRVLETTDRDHILHQFHVFVFGTLVIRTEGASFLKAYAKSLKENCDIGHKTEKDKPLGDDDSSLVLLLQAAWFLVSTCHDIGRPVQTIDDIIESLRKKVGQLVQLDTNTIAKLPKLKVDSILYDDPRTYLLLRELAIVIATWLGEKNKMEDWWYFFRYMAFEVKNHAFASALSLGLALTDRKQRNEFSSLFTTDPFGRFIASQILLPIVLHHAYDWNKDLEDLKIRVQNAPPQKKTNVEGAIGTIWAFLENGNHPSVRFDQFPLSILLAVTDLLQEDERPSGSKKEHWPDVHLPNVNMWEKNGHLNLLYKSTLQYSDPQSGASKESIDTLQTAQLEDIKQKQLRTNRMKAIFDLEALKNVFFEAKTIQFSKHSSSIFEHRGDSFVDESFGSDDQARH